jgi:hypothetical protein
LLYLPQTPTLPKEETKMATRSKNGDATVTGPAVEGRSAPSLMAGVSLAITLCTATAEDGTFYVRDHDDRIRYRVLKGDHGDVLVEAAS